MQPTIPALFPVPFASSSLFAWITARSCGVGKINDPVLRIRLVTWTIFGTPSSKDEEGHKREGRIYLPRHHSFAHKLGRQN